MIALLAPLQLGAQNPGWRDDRGRTAAEVSLLPAYCQSKMGYRPGPAEAERWRNAVGPETWEHVHHYCQGLIHVNNATLTARKPEERQFLLRASVDEFNYMIKNAPANAVLMPEILTKKGETLIRMGRAAEAIQPLQHAIELKPDYWPPYAALSDYYKSVGNTAKAREWLDKALAIAPESKALRVRQAELGGSKAGPPPAQKPVPQAPAPKATAEPEAEPEAEREAK
ncbi:MAG TPA: tetratricopeptide repeat protein [Burkholderiales bacterium]|nr:tetratricopeptide repeat protein [Burkholderiales bacterium]